jgi:uncharacterized damage-inducible protein DinB
MADSRPPRFASSERETVLALWRYHRESFVRKLRGVSEDDARRCFVGSETTLLWLANHMAGTQRHWIVNRFEGRARPTLPEAEALADAVAACEQVWREIDEVIEQHDWDELCAESVHGDTSPVNLRWVVVHLLEETARHAGHADIIRELIDGSTGR